VKRRQYAKKNDANQPSIVDALLRIGCEVEQLSGKKGMPDLLVSLGKRLFLLEVKNPEGKNEVNEDQEKFHKRFPVSVVRNDQEALQAVTDF